MKRKLFLKQRVLNSLLGVLCCFAFTACTENKTDLLSGGDDAVLQLGASVTGLTRANDAGFEAGDSLGVFVVKWKSNVEQDSLLASGNYADNICFRLDKLPNDWIADRITYYPNDDNMIDLYAYYPYRTPAFGAGTVVNLTVAANQSSYRNYTLSDFMVAQTDSVSRSPFKVPLIFDHKLSQMVFELKPGTGFTANDLMNAKVKVMNAITDATFDLAAIKGGAPVAGATRADIIPCGTWTESGGLLTGMKAIVVPQPINTTTYIQVTIGSRTFTYKPTEAKNMNVGCSRKFIITINNTGLDITTAINPWDNCPLVEGDAEEEWPVVFMQTFVPNPSDSVGTEVMLTDKRDNIIYRCIKMADGRWWMGENLKHETDTGSSVYDNDPENLEIYGRLYDWQTAIDAAPENWNVPSDNEWKALEIALGMTQEEADKEYTWRGTDQGTQLKQGGSSKIDLQLGGYWNSSGYGGLGSYGHYWSSTAYDSSKAWNRPVYSREAGVPRNRDSKTSRYSVRCILKEKETTRYMQTFVPNPSDSVGTEIMLTDKRDNIVYRCIKMADGRWWMGENLKYKTATGSSVYEDNPANLETYGRLYEWQTAIDAAPENWGVPSDNEWKALEMALGMTEDDANGVDWRGTDQGTKLKQSGSSKINLQLGGYWMNGYGDLGSDGFYWSCTAYDSSYAWYRYVLSGEARVLRNYWDKSYRFSVRCVRNL